MHDTDSSATSTVLIADDDPKSLLILGTLLRREGYRVVEVADGFSVLQVAPKLQPDAVILDVMMPEMDGFDVCRRLRGDPIMEQVPIILLTALEDRDSRLKGLEVGADDFFTKPVDASVLRSRMRTITRLNRFRRHSENAARFEATLANAPDPIAIVRPSGTFVLVNTRFEQLVPTPSRPAHFFELIPAVDRERWQQWTQALVGGGTDVGAFETTLTHRVSGQPRVIEITASLIPWERERAFQFNLRDLTDRRLLEGAVMQAQRLEMLGQLAGGIVHDLNNVLAAIQGNAHLAECPPDSPNREFFDNIETCCQRGQAMLRQLLHFARGEESEPATRDLVPVVREVTDLIRKSFGHRYQLRLDSADHAPAVRADPVQVHRILMNLCVNARDAMPGGGLILVKIYATDVGGRPRSPLFPDARPGPHLVIEVLDHGPGIPGEVFPRLFEPFFSTKGPQRGTGLGLATVLRLMQRHKGFVVIRNQPGAGATIRCHFPVADPAAPAPPET